MSSFRNENLLTVAQRLFEMDEAHYPVLMKEVLQVDLLRAMTQARLFDHLVFRGGTALRLCYRSVRHSEDLDFLTIAPLTTAVVEDFERTLRRAVQDRYGLDVEFRDSGEPQRTSGRAFGIRHWEARIRIPAALRPDVRQTHFIRVDVADVPAHRYGAAPVSSDLPLSASDGRNGALVLVLDPDELLTEKTLALARRDSLKWRDVFDVWHLLRVEHVELDPTLQRQKLHDHGLSVEAWKASLTARAELLRTHEAPARYVDELSRFILAANADHLRPVAVQGVLRYVARHLDSCADALD